MTAPAAEYERLLAAAAPYLHLRHPGHANQKVHGRRHGMSAEQFDERAKGALDDTIDINDHTYHSMSSGGGRSLNDYSHGDSFSINDSLRQSKGSISDIKSGYVRESAAGVNKAFGEVKTTGRDIVVTRGVQDIEATFAGHDPKAGLTWIDHGYVSTSSRSAGQNDMYHGEAGAQMRILVPKGTRAVSNENLEPDEIVLDRGYTFRVVRDRGVDLDGIRQLDVEVIPARPGTRAAGDAGRGGQLRRRAGSTFLDRVIDKLPTPVEIIDESELPVRSGYGTVAVTGDAWLRERAQRYLAGLPHLRHPGHANQQVHGHKHGATVDESVFDSAAQGQDALAATPAKLKRAPEGHQGNYEGEALDAPPGHGSVRALSEYEGVEYERVNSYLRQGPREVGPIDPSDPFDPSRRDKEFNEKNAERVREIDKTMEVSRLQDDVVVHRVIRNGSQVFGRDAWYGDVINWNESDFAKQDRMVEQWESGKRPNLTGLKWREKGYSSTSADPNVPADFGKRWKTANSALDGEPVIMRMHVRKGTGAVQLAEWGHAAEVLLQHDLTHEVVADHGVGSDGFRHIDVIVTPAEQRSQRTVVRMHLRQAEPRPDRSEEMRRAAERINLSWPVDIIDQPFETRARG